MHLAMTQGAPQGAFALGQRVAQLGVLSAPGTQGVNAVVLLVATKGIVG